MTNAQVTEALTALLKSARSSSRTLDGAARHGNYRAAAKRAAELATVFSGLAEQLTAMADAAEGVQEAA